MFIGSGVSEPALARLESREMVADGDHRARDNLAIYVRLPVTTGCYALGLDGEFHVVRLLTCSD